MIVPFTFKIHRAVVRLRSKVYKSCAGFFVLTACALALIFFGNVAAAQAQVWEARVTVVSLSPARVRIEGARPLATRVWSFRNSYAGITGLGARLENVKLVDASGKEVATRQLAPGEYEAESAAKVFSYEVKLDAPLVRATDAAYASWLTGEHGFLMLGDLLPRPAVAESSSAAKVSFILPARWSIISSETKRAERQFETGEIEKAVFYAGQNLRERRARVGATDFVYVASGDWAFTDEDVVTAASAILKDHRATVGDTARRRAVLMLAPSPNGGNASGWSAETRGESVMLLLSRAPSRAASRSQFSFALAHELFHLWIPNDLALEGNYDWFYEGFTLYQALRAGMRLGTQTFQDYLVALARAYDSYKSVNERDRLSLIELSERRWTTSPALIYSKGMLVAFLYDLALRKQTKNGRTLEDVYRELFRRFSAPGKRTDGNRAVVAAMNSFGEMGEFTKRYVEEAGAIDLQAAIAPFGLMLKQEGARTQIYVSDSLSREQRDLLRKLGYNGEQQRRR